MRNVVAISLPKQLDEQMTGFIAFFRGSNPLKITSKKSGKIND